MKKLCIPIIFLLLFTFGASYGQNRISVSSRSPIYLDLTPSYNVGMLKKSITNDSQWLNYTTVVHPSEPTISITVEIASGSIPDGMELQIEAGQYAGMSKGKQGSPGGKIKLSNRPQVLINSIGTAFTGSGRNEGHRISYTFNIIDYARIKSGTYSIFVVYTITQ